MKKFLPLLMCMLGCGLGAFNEGAKKPQLPAPAELSDTLTVTISDTPTTGSIPLTVNFTGVVKSSANSQIIWWEWTFGDGEYCIYTTTTTASCPLVISHTYTAQGKYSANLSAKDALGTTWITTVTITANQSDILSVGVAYQGEDYFGNIPPTSGTPLTFTFQASSSNGVITTTYANCGNGIQSYPQTLGSNNGIGLQIGTSSFTTGFNCEYLVSGTYVVTVVATDSLNQSATQSLPVTVN